MKFGGVQIHGGKENLIDGNVFVKCFAGVSFSRWPEQRWRDSIERFLPQAATPAYAERYPALANLVENPNVNTICRNAFVDCGPTLLRDGGIQKTKTNAVSDDTEDPTASLVLNAIPTDDIGPYDHPLRAPQRPLR